MTVESALVVLVPQAEPLVGALRSRFDPSARAGMGAHITILYPFLIPSKLTPDVHQRLQACLAKQESFAFRLSEIGRFPATVYLSPDPPDPFVRMTRSVVQAFPDCAPYGGAFETIVPHLTIADEDADAIELAQELLRTELARGGGVESACEEVQLLTTMSDQ